MEKIKIPHIATKGQYVAVVIVKVDDYGNEIGGSESYAVMAPDGSISARRYPTQADAEGEAYELNHPRIKPKTRRKP